jgi:hypothetical protein
VALDELRRRASSALPPISPIQTIASVFRRLEQRERVDEVRADHRIAAIPRHVVWPRPWSVSCFTTSYGERAALAHDADGPGVQMWPGRMHDLGLTRRDEPRAVGPIEARLPSALLGGRGARHLVEGAERVADGHSSR